MSELIEFLMEHNQTLINSLIVIFFVVAGIYVSVIVYSSKKMRELEKQRLDMEKIRLEHSSREEQELARIKMNGKKIKKPRMSIDEINDVLYDMIKVIIHDKYLVEHAMNQTLPLKDSKEELKELSLAIVESFGTEFLEDVHYYFSDTYISKKIIRLAQHEIIHYIDTKKP